MSSQSGMYGNSVDVHPLLDQYSESLWAILRMNEGTGVIGIPVLRSLKHHIVTVFGILDILVKGIQFRRAIVSSLNGLRRIMSEVLQILHEIQELNVIPVEAEFPLCGMNLATLYYLSQTFEDFLEIMEIPCEEESRYHSLLSSLRDVTDVYPFVLQDLNVPFEPVGQFTEINFFMASLKSTFVKIAMADGVPFPDRTETNALHQGHDKWRNFRSPTDEYEFLKNIGQGTFGHVAKYFRIGTQETVALKVTHGNYSRKGFFEKECKMALRLNKEDRDNYYFVRTLDMFCVRQKGIIVFECLGPSLLQSLTEPFSLGSVSLIAKQIFEALAKLKQLGIIHTDIKPDNILFVDPVRQPLRIKIIDFDKAIDMVNDTLPDVVQPLVYRAPEVLLGLSYCEAIDMWSAGCLLAHLLLGHLLYPGRDEREQMQFICAMQGLPPEKMLDNSPKAADFFYRRHRGGSASRWLLKEQTCYEDETACSKKFKLKTFMEIFGKKTHTNLSFATTRKSRDDIMLKRRFVDLLKQMLSLNPDGRITPQEALQHNFVNSFQRGLMRDLR